MFCGGPLAVEGMPLGGPYTMWAIRCPCGKSNGELKGLWLCDVSPLSKVDDDSIRSAPYILLSEAADNVGDEARILSGTT